MRSFHVTTFGCQMNVHDSERMRGMLISLGYEEAAEAAGGLARAEVLAASPATTLAERLRFMSPDLASDFANINAIDALVPNVPEVATAATSVLRAGAANVILTDGGLVLDGASHVTEDFVDLKSRIEPTFTAPLIHLP